MTQAIALDVHAHLIPVEPAELAAFEGVSWDGMRGVMSIDGHEVGIKSIYKPAALLDWMAGNGVAKAYISAPPPLYRQQLRGEQARRWADYVNAGLLRIAEASGGRLQALLHLPTEAPDVAAGLAGHWSARGHRHFAMPAGTGDSRTLGLPEFDALWLALDRAAAFVFLHPGDCADGRLKSFYLTNLLGNPYESAVALSHLALAGVLERHTAMTLCFAHGGGLMPMAAARLQHGFDTERPGVDTSRQPPAQVLRRVYADCICHGEPAVAAAEATFGADKVVFGSDWPFPMGLLQPHAQLEGYEAGRRRRLFETNPALLVSRLDKGASE